MLFAYAQCLVLNVMCISCAMTSIECQVHKHGVLHVLASHLKAFAHEQHIACCCVIMMCCKGLARRYHKGSPLLLTGSRLSDVHAQIHRVLRDLHICNLRQDSDAVHVPNALTEEFMFCVVPLTIFPTMTKSCSDLCTIECHTLWCTFMLCVLYLHADGHGVPQAQCKRVDVSKRHSTQPQNFAASMTGP